MFFDRAAGGNTENDFITSYQTAFSDRNSSDIATKKGIDYSLLTEKPGLLSQFWYYEGSTTSPTCVEVLNWVIPKQV